MGSPTVQPNIFITGVMKGGTTILHEYLCTHPDIQSGSQKEIHYFSLYFDQGEEWYLKHFSDVKEGSLTVDASPTYFDAVNTPLIPKLIKGFGASPRVMVIVRDPIERAISQFVHLKKIAKVPVLAEMNADEFFSHGVGAAFAQTDDLAFYLNQAISFSFYSRKAQMYRSEFEKDELLILHNADLRSNPKGTMQKVFEFVGVDYAHHESFGDVKFSNGSSVSQLTSDTFTLLSELFYPDYEHFCNSFGLAFNPIDYDDVSQKPTSKAA